MDIVNRNGIVSIDFDYSSVVISSIDRDSLLVQYTEGDFVLMRNEVERLAYRLLQWCNTGSLKLPTDKET